MDDLQARIIKKGEICLQVSLRRSPDGVALTAKAHPSIEDLVRTWGSGEKEDVKIFGRHWTPKNASEALHVWNLNEMLGNLPIEGTRAYRIDLPGYPMSLRDDAGRENVINLSFLRCVGISENTGVTFGLKGVYTTEALRDLAARIQAASRQFYISYLRPIDLNVTVSTTEFTPNLNSREAYGS